MQFYLAFLPNTGKITTAIQKCGTLKLNIYNNNLIYVYIFDVMLICFMSVHLKNNVWYQFEKCDMFLLVP